MMNRRDFLIRGTMATAGCMAVSSSSVLAAQAAKSGDLKLDNDLYAQFQNPDSRYKPYVRWWWNGDKVEAGELVRELRVLKEAGIGGVEINPVEFPAAESDMGIRSLEWLSDEWIDMLQVTFDEAKKLGIVCDLIVGSGWPFGAEYLKGDERGQIMIIGARKLTGPIDSLEVSKFALLKEADPKISNAYPGRTLHLISLKLVPDPINGTDQIVDLSDKIGQDVVTIDIPEGKHVLYALVRIDSFGGVICGAPGASGPTLNHLNKPAVEKYLNHMSDTIQKKTGPLSNHLRAFFTDSMELEGANWTKDMAEAFQKRNGYDIMPFLGFTMFKIEGMGNVVDYNYGADMGPEFKDMIDRMRYDMEVTKAEMFRDRFNKTFVDWCKKLNVKSRAQTYGRGFFPLETSMMYDIPEGESWTTNWLQHRVGEEMSNEEYRAGRAYTMINKYISSGAHLTGKRLITAEEMTNTYRVFNATLEFLKIGCDQNAIAGITHSIFHGFSYSPPEAPFPGWVRYGTFHNERNNWWPYAGYFYKYRARVSALLQNADMYADIAILPPVADMWTAIGMQNEPFPSTINVPYQTLLWEAMNKTGNGTDYVSEPVIRDCKVNKGRLWYGKRSYSSLFLIEVESMEPSTLDKLIEFVSSGGKVFCIEKYPHKSLGWNNYKERDRQITAKIDKLKTFPDRFILLQKPANNDFVAWYPAIQKKYGLTPFVSVAVANPFVMINRYIRDDKSEMFFFINSHLHQSHQTKIAFAKDVIAGKNAWVWDLDKGERFRIDLNAGNEFDLYLGPADSRVIVFDKEEKGPKWNPIPVAGKNKQTLDGAWDVEFRHSLEKTVKNARMDKLDDLKETEYVNFTGTAVYRKKFNVRDTKNTILNLGKVYGVSEVKVNGKDCGVTWYGNRLYDISDKLRSGENEVEVYVTTTMGNYMKTLKDNKTAQMWVNQKRGTQPIQSMGLAGPVTIYES